MVLLLVLRLRLYCYPNNNIRITNYCLSTVTVKYILHNILLLSYVNYITNPQNRIRLCKTLKVQNVYFACHKENRIKHVIENDVYSHKLHNLGQCRRLGRTAKLSSNTHKTIHSVNVIEEFGKSIVLTNFTR